MSDLLIAALAGVAGFFVASQVKKEKDKKEPQKVYKELAPLIVDKDVREQQILQGSRMVQEPISSPGYKERIGKLDGGMYGGWQ